MKGYTVIISSFLFMLLLSSYSNQSVETYSLTIHVDKLKNSKGIVQFALYNKDGSIPDEEFKKIYKILKAKIINGSSTIKFNNIPIGKYAVNIFHDENNNGKIDKGYILPIEGIGFSNYETIGLFNRPNFVKASFNIGGNKKMIIKMIYL